MSDQGRQAGDWACLVKSDKLNEWASAKLRECCSEVEQEDEERKVFVQNILQKSTDFLGGSSCQLKDKGRVTSYVCPHCHRYPSSGGSHRSTRGSSATGGAQRCGGQYDWRNPNRVFIMQDSTDRREAKGFQAHAPPHGTCKEYISYYRKLAGYENCVLTA